MRQNLLVLFLSTIFWKELINVEKKIVIFDLDGTLYQTHLTTALATQKALLELGLPEVSNDLITSLIGEKIESFCNKIAPNIDANIKAELVDRIRFYESEFISKEGKLFDGIETMLYELNHMGYLLIICSNGSNEYVDKVLKSFGIAKLFTHIRCRDNYKTKAEIISELLQEIEPWFAIVVGDRIYDIDAAKKNRIPSIAVTYGYGGNEVNLSDFKASNVKEIKSSIKRCEIFNKIEKDITKNKSNNAFIIGVNGVDTSGKTKFSLALHRYLVSCGYDTIIIHMDDFHNLRSIRNSGDNEIDSYIDNAFNLELLEQEILSKIKENNSIDIELSLVDLESDTRTNKNRYKIEKETIVIIEGVLLYRHPIENYFDYKIYLDIEFEEVLRRAEIRDVPIYGIDFLQRYKRKYIPIQLWYIENCMPKQKSDIVIDNTDYYFPKIKGIL